MDLMIMFLATTTFRGYRFEEMQKKKKKKINKKNK